VFTTIARLPTGSVADGFDTEVDLILVSASEFDQAATLVRGLGEVVRPIAITGADAALELSGPEGPHYRGAVKPLRGQRGAPREPGWIRRAPAAGTRMWRGWGARGD
jgi:hypothetical protein